MYRDNVDTSGRRPRPRRRRGIIGSLLRPLEIIASSLHFLRWSGRSGVALLESELEQDEAGLFAPNDAGLPEADLTEEQRQEAIRRIKNRPRKRAGT